MKNTNISITIVCLTLILSSCKSLDITDYKTPAENSIHELVSVQASVDYENIEQYIAWGHLFKGEIPNENKKGNNGFYKKNGKLRPLPPIDKNDKRVKDIIKQYSMFVYKSRQRDTSNYHGEIAMKIIQYNDFTQPALSILSYFTLGLSTLVGIPASVSVTEIKIEVSILNRNGTIISHYTGQGYGRSLLSPYGYGSDFVRKSNLLAFNRAMQEVETKMQDDIDWINQMLKN